jgi:hypothetical protein
MNPRVCPVSGACSPLRLGSGPVRTLGLVAFGDLRVVESAFGGFGFGGVGRAGVSAFGQHHPAIASGLDIGWLAGPQGCRGLAQLREEVLAARIGGVRAAGRAGPDDRAVG